MAKFLPVDVVGSKKFTYNAKDKTFTTEASTLHGYNFHRQLYADAIDIGFAMKSSRTGEVEYFHQVHTEKNAIMDVLWWEYKSVNIDLGLKVIIFND